MNLMSVENITAILTIISISIPLAILIWKKVIVRIWEFFKKTVEIHEKVDLIFKEVTPNGGGSIRDIIHKINERTIKTEERQKAILNDTSYAIFETSHNGEVNFVNKTYATWLGRTFEESYGMSWVNNIHPDDRESFLEQWEESVKLKKSFNMAHRMVNYYNEVFHVQTRAQVMKKTDGSVIGWLGFIIKESDIQSFNAAFPKQHDFSIKNS